MEGWQSVRHVQRYVMNMPLAWSEIILKSLQTKSEQGETMIKDEAMKMALEALDADPLEMVADVDGHMVFLKDKAITAIKEALAQEQEPVAWEQFYPDIGKPQIEFAPVKIVAYNCTCGRTMNFESDHGVVAPQRTWVGLDEEDDIDWEEGGNLKDLVKAIEDKLRSKNNG